MDHRVKEIFEQLCDTELKDRACELDRLCGDDEPLRNEVESLLHAHDSAGEFLDQPTIDQPTIDQPNQLDLLEGPGTEIGTYKLLQLIGEGGFGSVYMAQQEKPIRRRVALKIIKPGMDSKQVIARFESERQALAVMDHPNIARVIDAGATDSGRPFFVMELVRGEPITKFCEARKLSLHQRLQLFQDVCYAIEHAHQKGIIHRDIKPSNVLVTVSDDKPLAKVIDFGIAKATTGPLTDKTLFTEFRQLVGTPLYMSPEQAEQSGVDVDTRTDIYSLGVLLYELLTGRTPIDPQRMSSAAWAEVQKMIIEEEPSKPSLFVSSMDPQVLSKSWQNSSGVSRLGHVLKGDLDWIVLKAIEKERSRRYPTASQLAADIDRYLNDQPVEASPPSRVYQLQKFARRNRSLLAGLAAVLAALLIGLVATGYTAKVAFDQKMRAEAGERQALRAATAAGASVMIPEADAQRLADGWLDEIAAMRSAGEDQQALLSEAQFTVWRATWFAQHDQPKNAEELIGKVYQRCLSGLGHQNATFLALCNLRIQLNEAYGSNRSLSADCYADLLRGIAETKGDEHTTTLLPEYAVALARADRTEMAVEQLRVYVEHRIRQSSLPSPAETKRLQAAIDSLMSSGQIDVGLIKQLQSICDIGLVGNDPNRARLDEELTADLQRLQGRWNHVHWKNGKVVERMVNEFKGTRSETTWVNEEGEVLRGRTGRIELTRSGGVKVMTTYLDSNPDRGGSFIYQLQGNRLHLVSGMLANRPSLPEIEMRVFRKIE